MIIGGASLSETFFAGLSDGLGTRLALGMNCSAAELKSEGVNRDMELLHSSCLEHTSTGVAAKIATESSWMKLWDAAVADDSTDHDHRFANCFSFPNKLHYDCNTKKIACTSTTISSTPRNKAVRTNFIHYLYLYHHILPFSLSPWSLRAKRKLHSYMHTLIRYTNCSRFI